VSFIKPTESFNLLITLRGQKGQGEGEEAMGLEEIEMALQNEERVLNFKESNFPNVILIDLDMEPLDAVKLLSNASTTVISKVVIIEKVVRTRLESILEQINNLASNRVVQGDSFKVICDLRGRKYFNSTDELVEKITEELVEKFNLEANGADSDWVVQIEVVGENTGISLLDPEMILKKI
jgi:tRNA acetyltransferase TAN1